METIESGSLTSVQLEEIKNEMLGSLSSTIIPAVIQEMTPIVRNTLIAEMSPLVRDTLVSEVMPNVKREITEATTLVITQIKSEIENEVHKRQYSSEDVTRFIKENAEILNKHEAQRDNALRKAIRLEYLL